MNKVVRMAGSLVGFLEDQGFASEEIAKLGWALRRQMELRQEETKPRTPELGSYKPTSN